MAEYKPWDKKEREEWQKRMDEIENRREAKNNNATYLGEKVRLDVPLPADVKDLLAKKLKQDNLKPSDIFVKGMSLYLNDELRINRH